MLHITRANPAPSSPYRRRAEADKPRRRKAAKTVKVPPLEKCLTSGGEAAKIPVAGGGDVLIDAADYPLVAVASWHWGGSGDHYAVSKSKCFGGRTTYLHRVIMRAKQGHIIDHKNGDRRNCRKTNLRKATKAQNAVNLAETTSGTGYRGIEKRRLKSGLRFRAKMSVDGASRYGRNRKTAREAAEDYDSLAREVWGDFASLNFPAPGERRCNPVGPALLARQAATGKAVAYA